MKNKSGVTLIVLAVTILVMTILTTTIVSSINNSGIIGKSKDTVGKANLIQAQEMVTSAWTKAYMSHPSDYMYIKEKVNEALEKSGIDTDKYTAIINEDGATIVARKDITTTLGSLITVNDYGKTVDYSVTVDGTTYSDWQIYYHNEEYVYLIATEGIKTNGLTEEELTEEEIQLYNIFNLGKTYTLNFENLNSRQVASLVKDYNVYANTTNYGTSVIGAIGAPTIELFVAAWNKKYTNTIIDLEIGEYGYIVNYDEISVDGFYIKPLLTEWLASPYDDKNDILNLYSDDIGNASIDNDGGLAMYWIRPVVCLKGSIPAVKGTVTDYLLVD